MKSQLKPWCNFKIQRTVKWLQGAYIRKLKLPSSLKRTYHRRHARSSTPQAHLGLDSLPLELCICIFEFLSDDMQAIRTCSETCHSWAAVLRPLVFRSFSLKRTDDAKRLHKLVRLHLSEHIRELTLLPHLGDVRGSYHGEVQSFRRLIGELPELLAHMSAAETLHIVHMSWVLGGLGARSLLMTDRARKAITSSFPALRRLRLDSIEVREPSDLLDILASFPLLEHCDVSVARFNYADQQDFDVAPQRVHPSWHLSKLVSMHLRACPTRMAGARHEWACVCNVLAHIVSPTLRHLQLSLYDPWYTAHALFYLPWEVLDQQLARVHMQSIRLVVIFCLRRPLPKCDSISLRMPHGIYDSRTIISNNLRLLRASGGQAFLREDLDADTVSSSRSATGVFDGEPLSQVGEDIWLTN